MCVACFALCNFYGKSSLMKIYEQLLSNDVDSPTKFNVIDIMRNRFTKAAEINVGPTPDGGPNTEFITRLFDISRCVYRSNGRRDHRSSENDSFSGNLRNKSCCSCLSPKSTIFTLACSDRDIRSAQTYQCGSFPLVPYNVYQKSHQSVDVVVSTVCLNRALC